nr:unnamed protein product [Callosobruchus analis]
MMKRVGNFTQEELNAFSETVEKEIVEDPRDLTSKIIQNEDGDYLCPLCKKPYKHRTSVYTHLKNDCGKTPQYYCTYCDFSAKFHHVLARHKLTRSHKKREMALETLRKTLL